MEEGGGNEEHDGDGRSIREGDGHAADRACPSWSAKDRREEAEDGNTIHLRHEEEEEEGHAACFLPPKPNTKEDSTPHRRTWHEVRAPFLRILEEEEEGHDGASSSSCDRGLAPARPHAHARALP